MKTGFLTASILVGASALGATASAQTAPDWSGFYVGGSVGYTEETADSGETVLFDTDRDGGFNDAVLTGAGANAFSPGFCDGAAFGRTPADGCTRPNAETTYALRAGYDWQYGAWVMGGLIEAAMVNLDDDVTAFSTTPASYTFFRDVKSTVALRARGGYTFDRFLAYGTAGVVKADIDHAFTTTNAANSFTRSGGDDASGYQLGGGVETLINDNLSVGLEYLFTSISDDGYGVLVGPGTAPPTNPFLLDNPTGTNMKRGADDVEFGTVSLTAAWRY